MSNGTKFISPSITLFEQSKKNLIDLGYTFYSHECKNTKIFKLVLSGLPQLNLNEIKAELKNSYEYNINVVNIKEIIIAASSVDDDYFNISSLIS